MRLSIIFFVAVFSVIFYSCSSDKKHGTNTSSTLDNFELSKEIAIIDSAWLELDSTETEKISLIKRLIDEVSYNPEHNPTELNDATIFWEEVAAKKLTPESLEKENKIEDFDNLSDSLIIQVSKLVRDTPGSESYPLCKELISDINELNSSEVLRRRIDYSDLVEAYNDNIPTESHITKRPSFYISD